MEKITNIKNKIIKNMPLIILCFIMFLVLFYSGINTFAANDDLPYSLLYRGNTRIENIIQVVKNQVADYNTINGRFLVHCMIQFLLIFDRVLFSIGNAIVIVATITVIAYIAQKYICNSKVKYISLVIIDAICFLLLFDFKWLIYWVAGSVNYVWMFLFVILAELYYLKTNFEKYTALNIIIFFLLANLHELSLVVAVVLYISIILEQVFKKKIDVKKIIYIIPIIVGAIILLKAPGNANRMSSYEDWYSLNIIEKLIKAVPELSKAILNINNGFNIIPLIYILVTIASLIKNIIKLNKLEPKSITNKIYIISIITIIITTIACGITKNKWLCVLLIIILAIVENYIHIVNKRYKFVVLSISMYAVAFSMCITPLYLSLRPNYYLYMYYSLLILGYIGDIINTENKFITSFISVALGALLLFELYIYVNIGHVVKIRENEIQIGIKNNSQVIYLTKIPEFFTKFHNEANAMGDDDYWCKKFYYDYHGINEDVDLVVVDE